MKIETESLFFRDIYYYDIEACHYQIMKNFGLDISRLNKDDKQQRNIEIGKMMGENPRFSKALRNFTSSIISDYLSRNKIKEDDVILRQYDGFITTKKLYQTNLNPIPIKEYCFEKLLVGSNRDRYIAKHKNDIIIKGVPNKYPKMNKYLGKLVNINFISKENIFINLEEIKHKFYSSNDWKLFFIQEDSSNNYGEMIFKNYGQLSIAKTAGKLIDVKDIDRDWYYNKYLRPFTEAIVLEFA